MSKVPTVHVCVWCDKPETAERPVYLHGYPLRPFHESCSEEAKCAGCGWTVDPEAADGGMTVDGKRYHTGCAISQHDQDQDDADDDEARYQESENREAAAFELAAYGRD